MAKTKVAIKIKGSPAQVKKALHTFTNTDAPILREADFRARTKQGKV
jgi:hypothetical protein